MLNKGEGYKKSSGQVSPKMAYTEGMRVLDAKNLVRSTWLRVRAETMLNKGEGYKKSSGQVFPQMAYTEGMRILCA